MVATKQEIDHIFDRSVKAKYFDLKSVFSIFDLIYYHFQRAMDHINTLNLHMD